MTVNDSNGKAIGKSVQQVNFGDLIVRGLRKKLNSAGYTVISVRTLPTNAKRGIDISELNSAVEQKSGLIRLVGKCDLRVRFDVWLNGSKSVSRNYSTIVSDYSITDQSLLLARLAQQATLNIADEAAPNIVKDILTLGK